MNLQIGLGLAAVLGHIFPLWADFKGGKGIATLLRMVLAIQPYVAVACVRGVPPGPVYDPVCIVSSLLSKDCIALSLSCIYLTNLNNCTAFLPLPLHF